jgi:hypothetical protein
VVDLCSSFDKRDLIADVSWDEEFTRRLFGYLNRDFLGPPGDSKIIILSDSNKEEEEVSEENVTDTEAAPSSAARSPGPIASTDDDGGTDKGNTPDQVIYGSNNNGDETGLP